MSLSALAVRTIAYANDFFAFGFTVLLHSTVIIVFAFLLCHVMRKKGMVVQSAILRAGLVAVLLSPIVMQMYSIAGAERFLIHLRTPAATDIGRLMEREGAREAVSPYGRRMDDGNGRSWVDTDGDIASPITDGVMASSGAINGESIVLGEDVGGGILTRARISVIAVMLFAGVWCLLSCVLFAGELRKILYTRRLLCGSTPVSDTVSRVCAEAAGDLGVRPPAVREHPGVRSTFLTGIFKPCVLTASGDMQPLMTTREIFVHELAHLSRRDHLWNFLGHAGIVLLPIQPLMWILAAKIEDASDYICDDYVVAHYKNDHVYASQLYDIANTYHRRRSHLAAGIGVLTFKSKLLKRVERILDSTIMRHLSVRTRDFASVLFLFVCSLILTGFVGFKREMLEFRNNLVRYTSVFASTIEQDADDGGGAEYAQRIGATLPGERPLSFPLKKDADMFVGDEHAPVSHKRPMHLTAQRTPFGLSGEKMSSNGAMNESLRKKTPRIAITGPVSREHERSMDILGAVPDIAAAPLTDIAFDGPTGAVMMPGVQINGTGSSGRMKVSALNISIPSEHEYGYLSETEREKMGDFYRSLRKNRKYPVWSPDASKIAFNDDEYGIWVVDADGGRPAIVYDNYYKIMYKSYNLHYGKIRTIGFSPDGAELAYRRYGIDESRGTRVTIDETGQIMRYYIEKPCPVIESVNLETGKRRILAENATDGCWSGGGDKFAYIIEEGDGTRSLLVKNLVNGDVKVINDIAPLHVCFGAGDESLVVSVRAENGAENVIDVPLKSGKPRSLIFYSGATFSDLSPDGDRLLCTDTATNRQFIYTVADNSITDIEAPDRNVAVWSRFSPDGTKLLSNMSKVASGSSTEKWDIFIQDISTVAYKAAAVAEELPESFAITGNFPNPFNMSTTIGYTLPKDADVEFIVYNSMGQAVRTLESGAMEAGVHQAVWDGTNDNGETVATGVYISRLRVSGRTLTHKMMVVK